MKIHFKNKGAELTNENENNMQEKCRIQKIYIFIYFFTDSSGGLFRVNGFSVEGPGPLGRLGPLRQWMLDLAPLRHILLLSATVSSSACI